MVTVINKDNHTNIQELNGLSTDTKPIDVGGGSTFWELDTSKGWTYDSQNINPATGNGWWEV
jgi:hypothetical protein